MELKSPALLSCVAIAACAAGIDVLATWAGVNVSPTLRGISISMAKVPGQADTGQCTRGSLSRSAATATSTPRPGPLRFFVCREFRARLFPCVSSHGASARRGHCGGLLHILEGQSGGSIRRLVRGAVPPFYVGHHLGSRNLPRQTFRDVGGVSWFDDRRDDSYEVRRCPNARRQPVLYFRRCASLHETTDARYGHLFRLCHGSCAAWLFSREGIDSTGRHLAILGDPDRSVFANGLRGLARSSCRVREVCRFQSLLRVSSSGLSQLRLQ